LKATGLAFRYAIPLFGGAQADVVRARLVGETCWPPRIEELIGARAAVANGEGTSTQCMQIPLPVSPHGFAMIVSVIQFFLWIFIAANLPTILRRRQ
jgi:hypothetical protein